MKEGDSVRDIETREEGRVLKVFHDGWLRIRVEVRMDDGQERHYNFWELQQVENAGQL